MNVLINRRSRLGLLVAAATAICVTATISGCREAVPQDPAHPSSLRIGVLPDESRESLRLRYEPLASYLSEEIGIPCTLVFPNSYAHLEELFHDGSVDLAYFGGMTFLRAYSRDGAVPLAMRDADLRFTTYFLTRADSNIKDVDNTEGLRLTFGSKLSTSGHLMPRYFLSEKEIDPESFYSEVLYSGSHDQTAYDIRDGVADVGAANSKIVDGLYASGKLTEDEVRILWETPPFADYVWAVRPDVPRDVQIGLRLAFLNLSMNNPEHAKILTLNDSEYFVPASLADFANLMHVAAAVKLLETSQ